ncbi:putative acyl-activating enzyme 19 [Acorus calamus]|uniref:Acyl-activating enzyme 19 n=1 Tax=Acorus calamus TaxID=4465 RepID=A0AAV9C9A6_ACOCL|nr:putative acyl-activating enzyme 19 [Acorus calamus]
MLETEVLHSVPIGIPISNCDIYLNSEAEVVDAGEIYVGGDCLSFGYLFEHIDASPDYVRLPKENGHGNDDRIKDIGTRLYFRTGDFARRLRTGELVFIGRKDRTVKVMGQRIALEEIEHTLREHPDVSDAAVTSHGDQGDLFLVANVVLRKDCSIVDEMYLSEGWVLSLRSWLLDRLPLAMIPRDFISLESLPMTTTGKIDYTMLSGSRGTLKRLRDHNESKQCCPGHLQLIKEAFCDALMIDEISEDGDFFAAGGNSISAAQVAYKLGIDMKLIYLCPTVAQLLSVLLDRIDVHRKFFSLDVVQKIRSDAPKHQTQTCYALMNIQFHDGGATGRASHGHNGEKVQPSSCPTSKILKTGPRINRIEKCSTLPNDGLCFSTSYLPPICSFSRCNKVTYGPLLHADDAHSCQYIKVANNKDGELQDLWKVPLKSCVDASPLMVVKDGDCHLFIGAHSHMFLCVDASRGFVRWEVKLEGRIECSAAITGDFSQVVVGCYRGKFYFLDFTSGSVLWVFQTDGEVKSQPVVDDCRDLIWCGTHDQNLYAIDYKKHCCIFRISCGGSVYGSPCIDKTRNMIYVASTSGRVTAISLKALSFSVVWLHESGAPIFGSLCINSGDGNVICCLVDGSVIALDPTGSIVWKVTTGGPIFAGACISSALPSQVLICSRNGSLYSFDLERGGLLWEYQTGDPITSSAYVDEQIQLMSDASDKPDRLACICTSSGSIHVIRINPSIGKERDEETECPMVSRYARMDLEGGIFSSPVMICGRIFVGCRDDYVHCINVVK